jgi:hypothetical protein
MADEASSSLRSGRSEISRVSAYLGCFGIE